MIAENKGLWPSKEALAQVKVAHTNSVESNTLVHDAAILLEAGQLDAADAKLNEALKLDEGNRAAYYYRDLVTEARYRLSSQRHEKANRDKMLDVSRAWEEPDPGGEAAGPQSLQRNESDLYQQRPPGDHGQVEPDQVRQRAI